MGRNGGPRPALGPLVVTTPDPRIVLRGDQMAWPTIRSGITPRQPADYIHTDGTVWTWQQRWRLSGPVHQHLHMRVYDLVAPGTD